jgi:RNA polymerase sigma-70 factor (ECF subfamily)
MHTLKVADLELVESIKAGHDDAFDELMRRYKRPVLNFVYRLLGNADEAEDVAQEVFIRVYQNIGTLESSRKFSTWLFAMAHHACIDQLRWRKRHPTESLDNSPSLASVTTPTTEAATHEIGEHISAAVAKLPQDQRTALILSEYQGQSHAEIAQVMRCSEKSVELRLYRAKQTLRQHLKFLLD